MMADFRIYARSLPDDQALNLFLLHLGLLVRCFTHLGEEHGRCYQHRGSPGSDCAMLTTAFESRGVVQSCQRPDAWPAWMLQQSWRSGWTSLTLQQNAGH